MLTAADQKLEKNLNTTSAVKVKFHGSSFLVASSPDMSDTPDFLVIC